MPEELAALPVPRPAPRLPALVSQVQPPVPGVVLKGPSAGLPSPRPLGAQKTAALPTGVRQDDSADLKPGQKPVDAKAAPPPPRAPAAAAKGTQDEPEEPPQ
jgi:hypothetical protein